MKSYLAFSHFVFAFSYDNVNCNQACIVRFHHLFEVSAFFICIDVILCVGVGSLFVFYQSALFLHEPCIPNTEHYSGCNIRVDQRTGCSRVSHLFSTCQALHVGRVTFKNIFIESQQWQSGVILRCATRINNSECFSSFSGLCRLPLTRQIRLVLPQFRKNYINNLGAQHSISIVKRKCTENKIKTQFKRENVFPKNQYSNDNCPTSLFRFFS